MMALDWAAHGLARRAFILAAILAATSIAGQAIIVVLRYGWPGFYFDYEIFTVIGGLAVVLGAPAALYLFRDPDQPPGPRWLGMAGTATINLALIAFELLAIYVLFRPLGEIDLNILGLAPLAQLIALFLCFIALIALQLAAVFGPDRSLAVWPQALIAAAAFVPIAAASGMIDWSQLVILLGNALSRFGGTVGESLWGIVPLCCMAGAITLAQPRLSIGAIAAPTMLIVLASDAASQSIGETMGLTLLGLLGISGLHVLLGQWRSWAAAIGDIIGALVPLVLLPTVLVGLTTPNEAICLLATVVVAAIAIPALSERGRDAWAVLAHGLGLGIGIIFLALGWVLFHLALTYAGIEAALADSMAPLFAGGGAIAWLLVAVALVAALLGAPIAILLLSLLLPIASKIGGDPGHWLAVAVFAGLAGQALHGWLGPALAGATGTAGGTSLRAAALGAVPPLLLAVLLALFPQLPRLI